MKKIIVTTCALLCCIISFAQKEVYFTEPCELIFQFADVTIENNDAQSAMRTSFFTNFPCYMNINFNNHFGIMPGVAIKNIGIKTKHETIDSAEYQRVQRRIFAVGTSLACKFGDFKKCSWGYVGAGIDYSLHFKQKCYEKRGFKNVIKSGEWFSDATQQFIPSVFVGIQTPISLNVKATYYLHDFINANYSGAMGDFSAITQSQLFTLTFTFIFKELPEKHQERIGDEFDRRKGVEL